MLPASARIVTLALLALCARAAEADRALTILERRCLGCHGPRMQAAGLNLATRAGALKALRPGEAAASPLLGRVERGEMPPGAPLPDAEKEALRTWINSGAPWTGALTEKRAGPDWWSLQDLREVAPPDAPAPYNRNPIDRWVHAALAAKRLRAPASATRGELIRRVTFDLTGLAPTPAEIDAFSADTSAQAWEKLVDRLLASPRYGERWARHWLDIARFAESEGFERDSPREHAWRYRDYVIASFNNDKPYARFALEQLAGDLLEPVTREGIVATALLTLGPTDAVGLTSAIERERASIREDQLEETVGVVAQAFLGLTVNCARCHDHKFDPISQRDYYRFKSAFEGVWQSTRDTSLAGLDELFPHGRPLLTPAEQKERDARMAPLAGRKEALEDEMAAVYRKAYPAPWPKDVRAPLARWTFDFDLRDENGRMHTRLGKDVKAEGGRLVPAGKKETATGATFPLPAAVGEKTIEAWIRVDGEPSRAQTVVELRNISGFRGASVDGVHYTGGKNRRWENTSVGRFRSKDVGETAEDTATGGLVQLAIVYKASGEIALYRNGKPYGKPYRPDAGTPAGLLQTFHGGDGVVRFTVSKTLALEEARLYDRPLSQSEIARLFEAGVTAAPAVEPSIAARLDAMKKELAEVESRLAAIPEPELTYAATVRPVTPTRVLLRGDVGRPGETVAAAGLPAIRALSPDLGVAPEAQDRERRLALAHWIASERNPQLARVMANRVWHHHFGAGLAGNPSDFGFNGGAPSHPELLDWLAAEFRRGGWSVKKLHKQILMSETYRQRRPAPRRLEAEAVRDTMLMVSGVLNLSGGGPSFQPFKRTTNSGSYHSYDPVDSPDPAMNRRTVYRMNINSGGNPLLDAFDCPVPSVKTPMRPTTTTPLQALSMMNNAFVQRMAKAFAARITAEAPTAGERIAHAFRLALGRAPSAEEAASAGDLAATHGLEAFTWAILNTSEFLYVP